METTRDRFTTPGPRRRKTVTPDPQDGRAPAYEQGDDILVGRTMELVLPDGNMRVINGATNGTQPRDNLTVFPVPRVGSRRRPRHLRSQCVQGFALVQRGSRLIAHWHVPLDRDPIAGHGTSGNGAAAYATVVHRQRRRVASPNANLLTPGPALLFVVVNGIPSNGTMMIVGTGQDVGCRTVVVVVVVMGAVVGGAWALLGILRTLFSFLLQVFGADHLRQSSLIAAQPLLLHSRAESLATKFEEGGGRSYIEEAIALDREALQHCPPGHPKRSDPLTYLAQHLRDRYEQFGGTRHPERSRSLKGLAGGLLTRHEQLGQMEDLDEAIVLVREALDLCPQGHPDRSKALSCLAVFLSIRYEQIVGMEGLDEAIVLDREALDLCLQGHPNRSTFLNNLAIDLSTRYKHLGGWEDLDEAIVLSREALDLRPRGHPLRSTSLNTLAIDLSTRYKQLGRREDLDEAIVLGREALNLHPQGHPHRSLSLNNLANRLFTRYDQLGRTEDLDEAIVLDREALDLRPQGHPDRSMSLNNLAVRLSTLYKELGAIGDLDEAIILGPQALDLRPQGHSLRADSLDNLARYLHDRFSHSRQLKDKEEVFNLYTQLVRVSQIVSSADLSAVREWVRMAHHFQHPIILLAYETSLQLLAEYLATLPSLPQHLSIIRDLTSSFAVDAFLACLRETVPAHAVELLEQGRGVFWTQLTRLHSPLADLTMSGPAGRMLADDFTQVTLLIRNALNSPSPNQRERLCHLNVAMHNVVTNVRALPGLSRFLLPPLFPDLQRAASGGPVIIVNASEYGCDALIVLLDRDPVHIPMHIRREGVRDMSAELCKLTERAKRIDVTRELAGFLRKLWDQIVSPIVNFLQTIHPPKSRIWWCPTAEFSILPLHAAGPFRKDQRNLPNIYISSYTPTLTALIRTRRRDPSSSATPQKRFIAIGQAKAAGETELVSVGAELDNIGQLVEGLATFTRIDGEESCISRVVEELGRNNWVHLACHGLPNPKKPFESAFALRDGHFTIQRIIGCDLKNPEFAYLSTCHTTVGDEESLDDGHPSRVRDAICWVPICDWDDVGGGRWRDEQDHVDVL
ncbi:CHAT domain-containing protein [Boletus coccyginus]|nr:CHAT domain-containing protein [Boletus coccyginus]